MRLKYLINSLVFYPIFSFANPYPELFIDVQIKVPKNTIDRSLTNEKDQLTKDTTLLQRSDYPTQIIRTSQNIIDRQINCQQVNEEIDKLFVNKITKDKFTYATYISCTYNPDTGMAVQFSILSYFDPLNEEAIAYLQTYLNEYNGTDLLGSPLFIESAKALVVALNLSVGVKKNINKPLFIKYREDRSNYYFKSNYELQNNLITDIRRRFITDDPEKILPFLDQWMFNHASALYKTILQDSNYSLMEPERIFLMDNGEPIFVSPIKFFYAHNCNQYDHHHCLKQGV